MPYGNLNVDTVTTSTQGGVLGAGNASIMKNRIINGSMVIDQRNAGASVTQTTAVNYVTDRFAIFGSVTTKFTAQQSTTAPTGFVNSLLVTSSSAYSVAASNTFNIRQYIEGFNVADLGWGTADAKTVTLSFWVQSSLTGTFGGSLRNSASDRSYPFSYTISVANTWEQKSITIAGDTTGTWLTNNGIGVGLFFSMGAGSTFSGTAGAWVAGNYTSATGATSVVGTSGATFYITGVQLEVGSSATGFEYRIYGTELANCQRYYQIAGVGSEQFCGFCNDSTHFYCAVPFGVTMRASPTMSYSGSVSGYGVNWSGSGGTGSSLTFFNSTTQGSGVTLTLTSGVLTTNAAGLLSPGSSNTINASAEL
jgi:hypothetical protein